MADSNENQQTPAEDEKSSGVMSASKELFTCGELTFSFKQKGKHPTKGVLTVTKNLEAGGYMPIFSDTLDIGAVKRREEFVQKLYSTNSELEATAPQADITQKLMLHSCLLEASGLHKASAGRAESVYPMTGMGNAKLFGDLFRDKVRYDVTSGRWLAWDGHRWSRENGEIQIQLCCRKVADYWYNAMGEDGVDSDDRKKIARHWVDSSSAKGVRDMMFLARSEQGISCCFRDLDSDNWLFNCLDGTVDLRSGELQPYNPADLITKLAPVYYEKQEGQSETPERWYKCLQEWHPNDPETIEYLQQLAGACLSGEIKCHCFPIFWGGGQNGKNIFIETLMDLMGEYATMAPRTLIEASGREEHSTELAGLYGMRLVFASEPKKGTVLKTERVKAMTGDKMITARFMRGDFFTFRQTHKLIMATQNLPVIKETTDAIWVRVHKLRWATKFVLGLNRDPNLDKKLDKEKTGILRWAIAGWMKLQQAGGELRPSSAIIRETSAYRDNQNPVQKFITESYISGPGLFVPVAEVKAAWITWLSDLNSLNIGTTVADVSTYLKEQGFINKPKTIRGETRRYWLGLGRRNNETS